MTQQSTTHRSSLPWIVAASAVLSSMGAASLMILSDMLLNGCRTLKCEIRVERGTPLTPQDYAYAILVGSGAALITTGVFMLILLWIRAVVRAIRS